MTKPQHTPGPWDHDMGFIVAPDPNGLHPDVYIAEIAREDDEGRVVSDDEQRANACLIAAAPELLATLRLAREALNTAPRFKVGNTDSYAIASQIERITTKATAQE